MRHAGRSFIHLDNFKRLQSTLQKEFEWIGPQPIIHFVMQRYACFLELEKLGAYDPTDDEYYCSYEAINKLNDYLENLSADILHNTANLMRLAAILDRPLRLACVREVLKDINELDGFHIADIWQQNAKIRTIVHYFSGASIEIGPMLNSK